MEVPLGLYNKGDKGDNYIFSCKSLNMSKNTKIFLDKEIFHQIGKERKSLVMEDFFILI